MVGHWEIRRRHEEHDDQVNQKIQEAFSHNLKPILLVGEGRDQQRSPEQAITAHLSNVLAGCQPNQVAAMAFVYEPETAIGVDGPAPVEHIAAGCHTIREWLSGEFGAEVAGRVRVIYGGSVTPASAAHLLSIPDLDGLGASRRGRNPRSFFEIVKMVAEARTS
jgi:triosephosphate isomerase